MAIATDELFLRRALELAAQGTALASPNPLVGALVVDERGRIVGSGTHTYAGVKHAEVLAIEQAGPLARGNTLYLNLEPCSHTGRTAPCADALIAAGIGRVVCSMEDPNPLVAGKGFARLRAAGIDVSVGGLEAEARRLNESFARYIRGGVPLVTLKAAMSLDGKIAAAPRALATQHLATQHSPASASQVSTAKDTARDIIENLGHPSSTTYITNQASRRRVHQMRHASDAILVGVGTILADDPLLTDRSGLPRRRRLLRVVLDSQLRLPLTAKVVESADDDLLVFCTFAEENRRRELEARGVRICQVGVEDAGIESATPEVVKEAVKEAVKVVPIARAARPAAQRGRPDLSQVLPALGAEQITSLLVEGGAAINWACLRAGVVDKLVLFFAPTILGPVGTVPWLAGGGYLPSGTELGVSNLRIERFDEDFAVEAYLRDPYQEAKLQP